MGGFQHSEGNEPPKQQEPLTLWHIITSQKTQTLTMTPAGEHTRIGFYKVVSRGQDGSAIALFAKYNVRVLEHCTIM
jgi:hypothetical protein